MNGFTKKLLITLLFTGLVLISGCLDDNTTSTPTQQQNTNQLTQTASVAYNAGDISANPSAYSKAEITGEIVDTMNSGGYTYIQLDDGTGTIWSAIAQTTVQIGDKGTIAGSIMQDFPSSTLGRTFESIIFADKIQAEAVDNPTHREILDNPESYYAVIVSGTVNDTMDTSGYTYIEIDDGTGLIWAAVSQIEIEIGDNVTVDGNAQSGFESLTLNKTFDVLVMGGAVTDDDTTTSTESDDSAPVSPHNF